MEETVVKSSIQGVHFNKKGRLTIFLNTPFACGRNPENGGEEDEGERCIYCKFEYFYRKCCLENKEFYWYLFAIEGKDQSYRQKLLNKICRDAPIRFELSLNPDNVNYPYNVTLLEISLIDPELRLKDTKSEVLAGLKSKSELLRPRDYKDDAADYERILTDNGISCLYHFTERRNIASILHNKGLFSWFYCEAAEMDIPFTGGNGESRLNDVVNGLHDYVRLSFCSDHPMRARLESEGAKLILLKIDPRVALWKDTLYSDINATDSDHEHGGGLDMLEKINFAATKRTYVRKEDPEFAQHQAEVLVKTHVPLEYILNRDDLYALVAKDSENAVKDVVYSE